MAATRELERHGFPRRFVIPEEHGEDGTMPLMKPGANGEASESQQAVMARLSSYQILLEFERVPLDGVPAV